MADIIYFAHLDYDYEEFSNFYPCGSIINNKPWKTVEHYFQAQKFTDPAIQEKIRLANSPGEAKGLGRTLSPLREDWEGIKDFLMYKAVRQKFHYNGVLRKVLVNTGSAVLVEKAPWDDYWGNGPEGRGQNVLGHILMIVREELR